MRKKHKRLNAGGVLLPIPPTDESAEDVRLQQGVQRPPTFPALYHLTTRTLQYLLQWSKMWPYLIWDARFQIIPEKSSPYRSTSDLHLDVQKCQSHDDEVFYSKQNCIIVNLISILCSSGDEMPNLENKNNKTRGKTLINFANQGLHRYRGNIHQLWIALVLCSWGSGLMAYGNCRQMTLMTSESLSQHHQISVSGDLECSTLSLRSQMVLRLRIQTFLRAKVGQPSRLPFMGDKFAAAPLRKWQT